MKKSLFALAACIICMGVAIALKLSFEAKNLPKTDAICVERAELLAHDRDTHYFFSELSDEHIAQAVDALTAKGISPTMETVVDEILNNPEYED